MTSKTCRSDILRKEYLEECFVADYETGALTWKIRPREHFPSERGWKVFNAQNAGNTALNLIKKDRGYSIYVCQILGIRIHAHHVLWTMFYGEMFDTAKYLIDHIDRNPLNNKISNLRLALPSDNSRNTTLDRSVISYDKVRSRWVVRSKFRCGTNVRGRFESEVFAEEFLRYLDVLNRGEYSDFFPFIFSGTIHNDIGFTQNVLSLLEKTNPPESEFLSNLRILAENNSSRSAGSVRGFGPTKICQDSYALLEKAERVRLLRENGMWKILVLSEDTWSVVNRELGGECQYKDREGARKAVVRCNSNATIEKYWK